MDRRAVEIDRHLLGTGTHVCVSEQAMLLTKYVQSLHNELQRERFVPIGRSSQVQLDRVRIGVHKRCTKSRILSYSFRLLIMRFCSRAYISLNFSRSLARFETGGRASLSRACSWSSLRGRRADSR